MGQPRWDTWIAFDEAREEVVAESFVGQVYGKFVRVITKAGLFGPTVTMTYRGAFKKSFPQALARWDAEELTRSEEP